MALATGSSPNFTLVGIDFSVGLRAPGVARWMCTGQSLALLEFRRLLPEGHFQLRTTVAGFAGRSADKCLLGLIPTAFPEEITWKSTMDIEMASSACSAKGFRR